MANRNKSGFNSTVSLIFPDNTTADISEADIRQGFNDLADSIDFKKTGSTTLTLTGGAATWDVGSFNKANAYLNTSEDSTITISNTQSYSKYKLFVAKGINTAITIDIAHESFSVDYINSNILPAAENPGTWHVVTIYVLDANIIVFFENSIVHFNQTLTDGATVTWNLNKGINAVVTLGGNRTLDITNPVAGMTGILKVIQDATGSRTLSLPANSKVINGGGGAVTLTTTAGATDILSFYYDGTNYNWTVGLNYT